VAELRRLRAATRRRAGEAEQRITQETTAAEKLLGSSCASREGPVEYCGWEGSVHTFRFANGRYADLFVRENGKKVIDYMA
jgi:hypothetical protein